MAAFVCATGQYYLSYHDILAHGVGYKEKKWLATLKNRKNRSCTLNCYGTGANILLIYTPLKRVKMVPGQRAEIIVS